MRISDWSSDVCSSDLVFALVIPFIMLAYVLRLIPRKKLKEINQALMIGPNVRRARLQPHIESYADKVMAKNVRKGALDQIARDRAEGYTLVLATASYRRSVEAIAARQIGRASCRERVVKYGSIWVGAVS